ncbi:hypothetical protein [Agrobacterium fabrum]|uniref:hypothetical protein n=1 Tax=Agrobacterium fabrum TaxID=1176649 RepID=UPI0031406012
MPALLLDSDQFGFRQLAKVATRCLGGNPGMSRQFARRQCLSAHQCRKYVGARCAPIRFATSAIVFPEATFDMHEV